MSNRDVAFAGENKLRRGTERCYTGCVDVPTQQLRLKLSEAGIACSDIVIAQTTDHETVGFTVKIVQVQRGDPPFFWTFVGLLVILFVVLLTDTTHRH